MTAGDVMVASPRMDMVDINEPPDVLLRSVIDTAHSRFPVFQGARDNIIGILMAKDLLKLQRAPELNIRALLRPAVFVPESKGLNDLLREFRGNRNHLAIVIDEFGRVAGLVTIEDVLEQIVGEIEDEFDMPKTRATSLAWPTRLTASVATPPLSGCLRRSVFRSRAVNRGKRLTPSAA
jgi:magnesium and cobalt transporter